MRIIASACTPHQRHCTGYRCIQAACFSTLDGLPVDGDPRQVRMISAVWRVSRNQGICQSRISDLTGISTRGGGQGITEVIRPFPARIRYCRRQTRGSTGMPQGCIECGNLFWGSGIPIRPLIHTKETIPVMWSTCVVWFV